MTRHISLYGIGSCRILDPLKVISQMGLAKCHHFQSSWYTHSTRDTLQKIALITGETNIDRADRFLLSPEPEKNKWVQLTAHLIESIDCYIIEISSIKSFIFNGIEVQQWVWQNAVKNAGINPVTFNHTCEQPPSNRDLSFLPPDTPDFVRSLAANGRFHLLTTDEIISDLIAIASKLGKKMLLVPSINLPVDDGTYLEDRVKICSALSRFAAQNEAHYFDPVPHILDYGRSEALIDLCHYTNDFKNTLAQHMFESIRSAL